MELVHGWNPLVLEMVRQPPQELLLLGLAPLGQVPLQQALEQVLEQALVLDPLREALRLAQGAPLPPRLGALPPARLLLPPRHPHRRKDGTSRCYPRSLFSKNKF